MIRLVRKISVFASGLALVVLMALSLPADAAGPKTGGRLIVGLETDLRGFDAATVGVFGTSTAIVANTIEEGLFDTNEKGDLLPKLALSAKSEKGGKSWLVKLRKGVKFHDGTPFDADVVLAHFNRLLDPANRWTGRPFYLPMGKVEKIDQYTVRFNLKHPWAVFPGPLVALGAAFAYIPSPKGVDAATQNRKPVGTGPYMFKEWRSGDRITVVRNPNYWGKTKPYLDEIVFRFLPDPQTRFASLRSGDLDVIWTDRGTSIKAAMKDKSLVTHKFDGNGATLIILLNQFVPPLDDVRVRRAIAHAWRQDVVVKTLYKNAVPVITDPYGASLKCGDTGYRKHDLAAAKKLIAAYGKEVVVEMIHTTTSRGREIGQLMKQFLKKIGVKVVLRPVDQLMLIQTVFTNSYTISGWRIGDNADLGPQLFGLFHSKSPYNLTGHANKSLDKLLETQRLSTDTKVRKKALCGVARIINDQAMILYGGGWRHYAFSRKHVKGIPPNIAGVIRLTKAWIDK